MGRRKGTGKFLVSVHKQPARRATPRGYTRNASTGSAELGAAPLEATHKFCCSLAT